MADPGTLDTAQLIRLSGLTDRRLRELAREGWLPVPENGRYQLAAAIQGLLRYYRERDESRTVQVSFDSNTSCAAGTGILSTSIKHAKRSGCAAFRGSRVYLAPLIRPVRDAETFPGELRAGEGAAFRSPKRQAEGPTP